MSSRKAVVWGASGHAKVVADAARLMGGLEVVGYLDELRPERAGSSLLDLPVLGGAEQLDRLRVQGSSAVLLGIGDCAARARTADRAEGLGFELPVVVHPHSILAADVELGAGSVVLAGAVVNPGVRVGRAVILNTSCSVDHDCMLEDGVHVSPGARLAGGVRVGRLAWLGIGAVVIQGVSIGEGAVIGAGSVVVRDVPPWVVAYGTPARVRKSLQIP